MSTSKTFVNARTNVLSWEFLILMSVLFGLVAIMVDKPTGAIKGKIALEQSNFGLYSYNIRQNKVFAVASGPREGQTIARGVWVENDGTFKIERLPVGEYALRVKAPGFSTAYLDSISIEEGRVAELSDPIKLSVLQPYISVASNTRVFTSKEKPRFWVTATGAIESTIKIYKRDLVDFIKSEAVKQAGVEISSDLSLYTSYNKKFHNPYSDSNPFLQLKKTLTPSYSDSRRADFKFDEHFEPGDYVVIAEAMDLSGSKRTSAIWWFSVTDLGLVVKHAPDQTLVRAIDLNTLKPVKGVSIDLFERDNGSPMNSLASSKTGPDGLCLIDLKKLGAKRSTYNPIVIGKNDIYTAYGAAGYWEGRQKHYSTYFYSDRPVYRLGQTVHYKAIVRELTSDGFKSADTASAVQVIIEDPDNSKLFDTTLYTSPHGTINGEFNIPESGKTGGYQISFNYPDGSSSYQSIEVAQYRKPEYKVEVLPLVNRIEAGSKLKAKVRATYFFGAPVANARVKYSVFSSTDWSTRYNLEPRPDYYSFYDSWSDQSYEYDYGGNLIAEGFAQTGETGEAEIEVETKPITSERHSPWFYNDYQDRTYKIEAEVTDISRLAVTASGSSIVSSGDYVVFVNPRSWVIQVGEAISTDIQVMDYQGKPVANKEVEVTLSRWPWDAVKHDHTEEKILIKQSVSTDASGKAQLSFATNKQWPTDTFYISAIVKDAHGHISCDGNSVWVASGNQPYYLTGNNLDKEAFKITLDKKVYQPGDTARVMISGPFKGNEGYEALVSVEGTRIHDYRIVALSASANLVEIPVKSGYAPNVYVSVTMVAPKKQFYFQTQAILVSPEQHFINLAIETDKEKYKPGETVTYKIKATNKNKKPVGNVELSLAVVDESIYSIRADSTPDIKKFFFRKRENWVSTSSSFPEQYSGGPDKIDPKLRKNFKDTAAWIPQLFTDSNGEASARIALPDNMTTWRATVRGISKGVEVGSQVQKVLVTQDIIARLALPRFYTRGDQAEISAIVHNYSEARQNITLTLSASQQFKTGQELIKNLTVDKDKAASFSWPVDVIGTGDATIRLKAIGQTGGDALERSLPIRALGLPIFEVDSGKLSTDKPSYTVPFKYSPDMDNAKLTMSIAASTIGQIRGSFASLIDYPYGCTEQTMSRLMPSIVAMQLHKKLSIPLSAEDLKKFDKVYTMSIDRLKELRHSDGSWGWWQNDQSNPYLTALILEGLKELESAGYKIDSYLTADGLKWTIKASDLLSKQLCDPKLVEDYNSREKRIDLARLAYTITLYGHKPAKPVMDYLVGKSASSPPEFLSYLAMAQVNTGDRQGAQKTSLMLTALANRTETTEDWEHSKAMLNRLKIAGVTNYTYRFTGVETTALAMRAVLAANPDDRERLEKIKTWLLLHRSKEGWSNTKTTAEVLRSLMKDALATQSPTSTFAIANLLIPGDALTRTISFSPQETFSTEKLIDLPVASLKDGISLNLAGQAQLYYRSLLSYFKTLKPGENLDNHSNPAGLKIERKFFKLETGRATSDGNLHLKARPLDGSIKSGEIVLMKVYVDAPMSLPYVIVESPLPSGGEVVESQGQNQNLSDESGGSVIEGDWGAPWWTHQDTLDDRIVFFGTRVPQGKSEFHTLIRMELPGKIQLNPVTLEGMYTDLIKGHSQPQELSISAQ